MEGMQNETSRKILNYQTQPNEQLGVKKMSEAQKRAVKVKEEIERVCVKYGINLTIYDDGIEFVDHKENKIVMVWRPSYQL